MDKKRENLFSGLSALLLTGLLLLWGSLGNTLDPEGYFRKRAFSHPLFEEERFWSIPGAIFALLFLISAWKKSLAPMRKVFQCLLFWGYLLFFIFLYSGNSWAMVFGGGFFLLFFFAMLFREKYKDGSCIFSGEYKESFFYLLFLLLFNSFFYQEGCNFLAAGPEKNMEIFLLPFTGLLLKKKESRQEYIRNLTGAFFLLAAVFSGVGLFFDLMMTGKLAILFLFFFAELAFAFFLRGAFPGRRNFSLLILALFLLFHRLYPIPGMSDSLAALSGTLFYIAVENLPAIQQFFRKNVRDPLEREKIFVFPFSFYQAQAWTCGAFFLLLFTGTKFLFTETAILLLLFLFAFFRRKFSFLPAKSCIPDFVFGGAVLIAGGFLHKSFLLPAAGSGAFLFSFAILCMGKYLTSEKWDISGRESSLFYAGSFFLLFSGSLFLVYSQSSATALFSLFSAGWGGILLSSAPFSRKKFRAFTGGFLMLAALFILLIPSSVLPPPVWTPGAIYAGILAFALTSFYYMLKENYLKEKK